AQPAFGFRDLVSVRSIVGLLERGVPLRQIRPGAHAAPGRFPARAPLPRPAGAWMKPDGKPLLAFVCGPAPAAVASLEARRSGEDAFQAAREWFVRGSELEVGRATDRTR